MTDLAPPPPSEEALAEMLEIVRKYAEITIDPPSITYIDRKYDDTRGEPIRPVTPDTHDEWRELNGPKDI